MRWAAEHTPDAKVAWAIEDTRSYGASLECVLRQVGQQVIDFDRPKRARRRDSGKATRWTPAGPPEKSSAVSGPPSHTLMVRERRHAYCWSKLTSQDRVVGMVRAGDHERAQRPELRHVG
ncbi:hypothetical protein ACWDRB_61020 [Nonomuraea sp. NPDC003707]